MATSRSMVISSGMDNIKNAQKNLSQMLLYLQTKYLISKKIQKNILNSPIGLKVI